jgi:hypothetical protein
LQRPQARNPADAGPQRKLWVAGTRVAPRCIGAPREHAQHPCQRVLCVACPGFLTVADMKGPPRRIGATRGIPGVNLQLTAFCGSMT